MSIVKNHDWEKLGRIYQNANPFPSICIDGFLSEDFASRLVESYPNYNEAIASGKQFNSLNENLKVQITETKKFPDPVSELSKALSDQAFLSGLTTLTGVSELVWDPTFTGGGMHLTASSGLLDVHVDFNYEKKLNLYRRLNILIYLNPVWEQEWGGNVELWDKKVKKCVQSFEPIFNRCVLFSTSDYSFHGVTAVTCPGGVTRNSFAAYYYTEEAGENAGVPYGGNHSTIFKARPYEYRKKYWSMPLRELRKSVSHCKKTIVGKLR